MSNHAPSPTTPTPIPEGGHTSKLPQLHTKRPTPPKTACGVCGELYVRLERHVRQVHSLPWTTYQRVYSHPLQSDPSPTSSKSALPAHLVRAIADACANDPDFLPRLASDVGAHLLGSGLREMLSVSIGALLTTRMKLAGDAAARLESIGTELSQPWRTESGGENGAPTSTRDLVAMAQVASAELDRTTDAALRAAKLSIDERRGERGEQAGDAPLDKYRGAGDVLDLPADIGPGERAIMLELTMSLARNARTKRLAEEVIDAVPRDSTDAASADL